MVRAYATPAPGAPLAPVDIELGPLGPEDVEVAVEHCGICHSDLSMIDNAWGSSVYPLVPGHEIVGRVVAKGPAVSTLALGQRVGVGWFSRSCMHCRECMGGQHHLCGDAEGVIVGRPGGFAERVRAHMGWALPLPEALDAATAGPLFCGGITVFNPLVISGVAPTGSVGVIGVGGLGHLAIQFAAKWGCEVVAFTSSPDKADDAKRLGAHRVVNSRDEGAIAAQRATLDLIISTVNVPLPWGHYLQALRPNGRLHLVGAVLEPVPVPAFALIGGQRSVSGSPLGSPVTVADMLRFAARHGVRPVVERFPMSHVNDALQHLRDGRARYRVILDADF